jgi:hypothetical protein
MPVTTRMLWYNRVVMFWLRILLAFPILLLLGVWLMRSAIGALQRGEANAAGTRVRWRDRPFFFFVVTVIVQLGFGALSLWQALRLLILTAGTN